MWLKQQMSADFVISSTCKHVLAAETRGEHITGEEADFTSR